MRKHIHRDDFYMATSWKATGSVWRYTALMVGTLRPDRLTLHSHIPVWSVWDSLRLITLTVASDCGTRYT